MVEMPQPLIEASGNGIRTLLVYYQGLAWDAAIEAAIKRFGLSGENINIIALSVKQGKGERRCKKTD